MVLTVFSAPAKRPADLKLYREALSLYENGMYERARTLFGQAAAAGDDPASEAYAALCALRCREADAEKAYEDFLARNPRSTLLSRIRFEHGRILFDEGRYEEAERDFNLVRPSALKPLDRAELSFKTGWCSYARREFPAAAGIFADVEKMPFSDYTAPSRYLLAYMAYLDKDFETAIKYFTLAAKDSRFKALSEFYLTDCQFMKKNYDYVLETGVPLFEGEQGSRRSHLARIISESYLVKGDAVKAREYHSYSTSAGETRADHFFSGSVFYAVKDYEGAIDNFLKMTDRTDSLGQVANYQLGWSYIQTKNKVAALDAFKAASEADFNYQIREDAAFNYAKLAFDLNHDSSAFSRYLQEYSTFSKGDRIYAYMALAALYDRDYAAAVAAYDNVETLDREQKLNYAKANYLRGAQLTSGGSWRDAVPYFKAAAFYLPKQNTFNQLSRYHLAESYYHSGSYKEALQTYMELYNLSALDGRQEGYAIPYDIACCHYRLDSYSGAARWYDHYIASGDRLLREDALTRRADCDFVRRKYQAAAAAYQKVMDEYPGAEKIYPRYQRAISLGLAGDRNGKVKVLAPVRDAPVDAPLYCDAVYELGRAYMDVEDYRSALGAFSLLRRNASDSSFVARALIGLGMTNRNMAEYDKALANYKKVVSMMPGSEWAEDALLAIESIYQTRKQPEKFLEYVEANSLASGKSEADREMMYFNTAEQVFLAENYPQALISLQKYLDKYPKGTKKTEAWFYMAESYRLTGQKEKACDYYSKVLESKAEGSFAELSLLGYAGQSYSLERFIDAYDAYCRLYDSALLEGNKAAARTGMMRSAYRAREYQGAVSSSILVLGDESASDALRREAKYVQAKSLLSMSMRSEAFALLSALSAEPSTPEGAEARWLLIQDAFDKGDFDKVENMVYDFSSVAGNQSYWLARAFVLLGDSFLERGNAAQAKATWESVRDGYEPSGEDDDIIDSVKLKLSRLGNE